MSDVWPLSLALPAHLRGRFASLADDEGVSVEEYIARLLWSHAARPAPARPVERLTREQFEERIVAAAVAGRTTREIAQELGATNLAVNTIRRRHGVGTKQIGGPRAA